MLTAATALRPGEIYATEAAKILEVPVGSVPPELSVRSVLIGGTWRRVYSRKRVVAFAAALKSRGADPAGIAEFDPADIEPEWALASDLVKAHAIGIDDLVAAIRAGEVQGVRLPIGDENRQWHVVVEDFERFARGR